MIYNKYCIIYNNMSFKNNVSNNISFKKAIDIVEKHHFIQIFCFFAGASCIQVVSLCLCLSAC